MPDTSSEIDLIPAGARYQPRSSAKRDSSFGWGSCFVDFPGVLSDDFTASITIPDPYKFLKFYLGLGSCEYPHGPYYGLRQGFHLYVNQGCLVIYDRTLSNNFQLNIQIKKGDQITFKKTGLRLSCIKNETPVFVFMTTLMAPAYKASVELYSPFVEINSAMIDGELVELENPTGNCDVF